MNDENHPGAPPASPLRSRSGEWFEAFIVDLKEAPSGPRFRLGTMVVAPLVVCLALTFWARFSGFDFGAQALFYRVGGDRWSLGEIPFWRYLYQWGTIPAAVVVFASLTLYCLSWSMERFRLWRKVFLFVVLTAVVGPGLITNAILKEYWGRPRPREVIEFGGRNVFEPALTIDPASGGLSFPCGHATMGFLLMGGYFLFRRHRAGLARGFLVGGIILGSLMGIARMVQGGHFFTDVIWAGLICYFVPMGLYYAMGLDRSLIREKIEGRKMMPLRVKVAVSAAGLAMLAAVMIASPYHEKRQYTFKQPFMETGPLDLRLRFSVGEVDFVPAERFRFVSESLGHGIPTSGITSYYKESAGKGFATFVYSERISGWFSEVDSDATLEIPWQRLHRLRVEAGETRMKIGLVKVPGKPVIELASGGGVIEIHPSGQPVRLAVEGKGVVEGAELLEPGKSGEGFYRLQLDKEFTGTVRIIGAKGE
jgi:lipid A 4'-phosphatase